MRRPRDRFVIALWFALSWMVSAAGEEPAVFQVMLADPVAPDAVPQPYEVVALSDADGSPTGYQLAIHVNVCSEGLCRMVHVTLAWDALGFYQRLDCLSDTPLTRRQHEPFTPDDYRKLDRILRNRESALGRLPLQALVDKQPVDLDGWSGATPQFVAESVVEGAAFTTWTLWRWANGQIVPQLRAATVQRATPEFVRRLLRSENQREVGFALRHLLDPQRIGSRLVDDALRAVENTGQAEYVAMALDYAIGAGGDQRRLHDRLIALMARLDDQTNRPLLEYFAAQPELPFETLDALSGILEHLSYFQVHRLLLLLEKQEVTATVEANVARLLDHENFSIARRAYEHLQKQASDSRTQQQLAAFRNRNRDRL